MIKMRWKSWRGGFLVEWFLVPKFDAEKLMIACDLTSEWIRWAFKFNIFTICNAEYQWHFWAASKIDGTDEVNSSIWVDKSRGYFWQKDHPFIVPHDKKTRAWAVLSSTGICLITLNNSKWRTFDISSAQHPGLSFLSVYFEETTRWGFSPDRQVKHIHDLSSRTKSLMRMWKISLSVSTKLVRRWFILLWHTNGRLSDVKTSRTVVDAS